MHFEVIFVEEQQNNNFEEENTPEENEVQEQSENTGYQPRPLWQRIGAWIALVLFVGLIIMYYINIMRGGL